MYGTSVEETQKEVSREVSVRKELSVRGWGHDNKRGRHELRRDIVDNSGELFEQMTNRGE